MNRFQSSSLSTTSRSFKRSMFSIKSLKRFSFGKSSRSSEAKKKEKKKKIKEILILYRPRVGGCTTTATGTMRRKRTERGVSPFSFFPSSLLHISRALPAFTFQNREKPGDESVVGLHVCHIHWDKM